MSTSMRYDSAKPNQRAGNRLKAVLPVRIKGTDACGESFEALVHTLDLTPAGARLGSVRRELNPLEEVTVLYRQRRIAFRVVWTRKLQGTSEFQVGLQSATNDKEAWGMSWAQATPQLSVSRAIA
jgi:hypothetical protein